MTDILPILVIALHALSAVFWVGGMVFAYMILRPAMGAMVPPERLKLWVAVFNRFFPAVWLAVALLLATGYDMLFTQFGGFARAQIYIHIMHGVALVMVALFAFLYFVPFQRLRALVAAEDWKAAGGQLAVIRRIVATNMVLGLVNVIIGSSGHLWG